LFLAADTERFAQIDVAPWQWAAFVALVAVLVLADLLVLHRTPKAIPLKHAAIESAVWIAIGLAFGVVVLGWHGG
jgi:tellurite resistance protein TerC